MKIIDYMLVPSQSDSGLTTEVKRLMGEGWQPQGSVTQIVAAAGLGQQTTFLVQTMVKYEPLGVGLLPN